MAYLYQLAGRELAGRGIAAIAAVAFLGLAGCAPSGGSAIAEGSSSPPSAAPPTSIHLPTCRSTTDLGIPRSDVGRVGPDAAGACALAVESGRQA